MVSDLQTSNRIWHNGKMVAWSDANVHVLSHTLHYGGGALEGIRFYRTSKGPAIFRLLEHIDRLFYSASVLKMSLPYSKNEISDAIILVVSESGLEEGYIRPIAFYGYGKLSIYPVGHPIEFAIACLTWGTYFAKEEVDVKVSSYIRLHPESTVIDAKICAHYLNGILATLELQGTHYHEALYLDHKGYVSEGIGANFFLVKTGVIYTPKLGSILVGITRDTIIKLATKMDIDVVETDITLNDIYTADEAFFTGTAAEVTSIRTLNDQVVGEGKMGVITHKLKNAYLEIVHGNNTDYCDFLTHIETKETESSFYNS